LALSDFDVVPSTPVVWQESRIGLRIENRGDGTFVPEDGNYTVTIIVKDADGKLQEKYVYNSEDYSLMERLPVLHPGDDVPIRLPSVFFLAPVSSGTLEIAFSPRDPDPYTYNVIMDAISIDPNPDTPKNCLAAILNAATVLGIPPGKIAKATLGFIELFTIDIPNCNGDIQCEIGEIAAFLVGQAIPIVDIINSFKELMTQPPETCLSIVDWIKMVLVRLIQRGMYVNMASVESTINVLVVNDQGQRAGFLDYGTIVQEIQDAQAFEANGKKTVICPGKDTSTVRLRATGGDTMKLHLALARHDGAAVSILYENVPVYPGTIGTIDAHDDAYALNLDDNEDGVPDRLRMPDELIILLPVRSQIYFPLILKRWPPVPYPPVLNPIDNTDGDGLYTVSWSPAALAETYVLEEDNNAGFSSPAIVYEGSETSWSVPSPGKSPGTYYYRVRGHNQWGYGPYSNVQSVRVSPFRVADTNLRAGECTRLSWNFTGIKKLHIVFGYGYDKEPVPGQGSRQVCPSVTTTYEAIVTKLDGSQETHQVTVHVSGTGCGDPIVWYFFGLFVVYCSFEVEGGLR